MPLWRKRVVVLRGWVLSIVQHSRGPEDYRTSSKHGPFFHYCYVTGAKSIVWNLAEKRGYVAKNTKISKYIFHKLPFYTFRIKFWCLETHPFNFERNGLFEKVLVAFGHFTVCCFEGSTFLNSCCFWKILRLRILSTTDWTDAAGAEQKTNVSFKSLDRILESTQEEEEVNRREIKTIPILQSVNMAFPISKKPTFQNEMVEFVSIEI